MNIDVTKTFAETHKKYHEKINQEIIDKNKTEIIEPLYRYRQIVSMGGSRSSKSYSILQLLLLEMVSRKGIKITVWRNLKNVCRQTVLEDFLRFKQANAGVDKDGNPVYLAQSEWFLNTEISNNPDIQFHFTSEIHRKFF